MKTQEFENAVKRTMNLFATSDREMLLNYGLGLAGEAGEVVDELKKDLFHRSNVENFDKDSLNKDLLVKELGDVLWYATAIANVLGVSLEEIMRVNILKLHARYPHSERPGVEL